MTQPPAPNLSYKDAGVDIQAGDDLVERIKPLAAATARDGCLGGLGGFGGLFQIDTKKYTEPVLVSGTDGVGTKLKLAIESGKHDTIGIDLVAMCVNDIIVCGAEPLFFLDYFATGNLDIDQGEAIVRGIAEGCRQSGAALLGGETAEMPGMYQAGDYDLAGFAVGVVDRSAIIDGSSIRPGDVLVGLGSSGPHSNGYSLVRKVLEVSNTALDDTLAGRPMIDWLLEPTRIYARAMAALSARVEVHGIAHITGGGLPGNVNRVLGAKYDAVIDVSSRELPEIFTWLQENGGIPDDELYRTFNCGIGMVLVLDPVVVDTTLEVLNENGEDASIIGRIEAGNGQVKLL